MLKSFSKIYIVFALICLLSCKNTNTKGAGEGNVDKGKDGGGSLPATPIEPPKFSEIKAKHKDMVVVIDRDTEVKGKRYPYLPKKGLIFYYAGVFVEGRNLTLKPYQIGKYEVTYELWTEVLGWALENGYTIRFQGRGGSISQDNGNQLFVPATEENRYHPVVSIPWRSMLVWCNAYSEMTGLKPVYYKNPERTEPIKSTFPCPENDEAAQGYDNINPYDGPGFVDTPYVDWDSTGFRLCTEAEWEMAARGGKPEAKEWDWKYAGCNDEKQLPDYAWIDTNSDNKTHEVGGKNPNVLGLYDMCGNVRESCFDWWVARANDEFPSALIEVGWYGPDRRPSHEKPANSARIWRGNAFNDDINEHNFSLGFRNGWVPTGSDKSTGFRVARSIRTR